MKSRIEETIARHDRGFNCAQAVACTYCDLVGLDEKTMFAATEALGAGMGGMQATCGAVSGACVLAGMKNSCADLDQPKSKGSSYKLSRQIVAEFIEQNGSCVCKELKGVDTGVVLRSCPDCIRDAAALAEKILFQE